MANQGFTAADMADQAASAFERGRESVLAELHAAAQEAVAWTVVGPDGKSSIGGWQDMKTHDFWKEAGVLREGHRYAYAYAAPVTAAPEGFVMAPVAEVESALDVVRGAMECAYHNRFPECCGQYSPSGCCGNPREAWSKEDQSIMDALRPAEQALAAMLAARPQGAVA